MKQSDIFSLAWSERAIAQSSRELERAAIKSENWKRLRVVLHYVNRSVNFYNHIVHVKCDGLSIREVSGFAILSALFNARRKEKIQILTGPGPTKQNSGNEIASEKVSA